MKRPAQKLNHLLEKIANKETRTPGKAGKRLKRWRKFAETYKAVVAAEAPQS